MRLKKVKIKSRDRKDKGRAFLKLEFRKIWADTSQNQEYEPVLVM